MAANRDRRLGPGSDYLAQSDLRELMQAALAHGWDLAAYDASIAGDDYRLLSAMNDRQDRRVLEQFGGTAGYLRRATLGPVPGRPVDWVIRSIHNELQ